MSEESEKRDKAKLTWKDYTALFIASLETIMLPVVVLIAILLILIIFSAAAR